MKTKVTIPIFIRTFFLFPIFMIFVLIPIMLLIIIASFLPYGKLIATKIYEFFGWAGLKFVGIKLIVKGAEKIDTNKSYVVVSNHPSTLDIFTHITALPVSIRFLTKTELANFEKINDSISKVIKNKNSIMIFPEGKRSNQKDLLPFKKGAAYISKDFHLPIVPVVTHNAHNLMRKGEVWLRSGEITLEILDPINNTEELTVEELTTKIYNLIDEKLKV